LFIFSIREVRVAGLLIPGLIVALAGQSHAQSMANDDTVIEEIIVTSRYRAEKLSDVPDSISA
jgi:hypothetical protein